MVVISKVHADGGDFCACAAQILIENSNYDRGKVLFKPMLICGAQTFRLTMAVPYPISSTTIPSDDKGFRLKQWVEVGTTSPTVSCKTLPLDIRRQTGVGYVVT